MSIVIVRRLVPGLPVGVGAVVDASGMRNLRALIDQRYFVPAPAGAVAEWPVAEEPPVGQDGDTTTDEAPPLPVEPTTPTQPANVRRPTAPRVRNRS